ncbi:MULTISPECIES: SpoIIE family protein phosphatase [Thiorhodovibrio]|uniref:SpoIIE family protein phosphatase n=1 Tax=Thiorhodovibrio TaxID=61593 RepID=UPI00191461FE|nr:MULTISPECIES: SpoIIE family protein phosphatase [Thiorhodovibrio]
MTTPTTRQSANLFRNYNRMIAVAYLSLLLALIVFFGYLFQRKLAEEIHFIEANVERHAQFFEFVLRSAGDQLETLRISAATRGNGGAAPAGDASPLKSPPGLWLRPNDDGSGFNLDALPDRDSAGNILGTGALEGRSETFYRDLAIILSLNDEWSSLLFNLPSAAGAHFFSTQGVQAQLPWRRAEKIAFVAQVVNQPVWQLGLPAANPDRAKYWAPVYFGGEALGLLAPVAVPIYDEDRFIGVLSIDLSVDYLNRINSDFTYPLGFTMLVDDQQRVLTHPVMYQNPLAVEQTPDLAQSLPESLRPFQAELLALPARQAAEIADYLVIRRPLLNAPWSMLYIVPMQKLWALLLGDIGGPMVAMLIGLALLMGLTYLLTSREFVGPAAKLVRHIAAESNFEPTDIPAVPSSWRPWFESITRAFNESMQLVSLRQELDIAARVQAAILPQHWPSDPRYALWGRMRPAKEIGGDFYDHFEACEEMRDIMVADVSDKGIPAGLFGTQANTLLRAYATQRQDSIGELMAIVNDILADDNDACTFVTLIYIRFNPASGELTYVNAGHPSPLLVRADGEVSELPPTKGVVLGVMEEIDYQTGSFKLTAGDTLILFSDGVNEAMNQSQQEFGTERLHALFSGQPPNSPREAVDRIFDAVDAFADDQEQSDDITCVALQFGEQDRTTTVDASPVDQADAG